MCFLNCFFLFFPFLVSAILVSGSLLIWFVNQRFHAKLKLRRPCCIRLLGRSAGRGLHILKKSLCLLQDRHQQSAALNARMDVDRL